LQNKKYSFATKGVKMFKKIIVWSMPIIVSFFVSGCGGSGEDPILGQPVSDSLVPTVVAVAPADGATNVFYNTKHITAEFNVPMDPATLTSASFTLSKGDPAVLVTGVVTYANRVAELTLDANLTANTVYTATITTAAKSADGVALSSNYVWTFTTGSTADTTLPTVVSTSPIDGATGVSITKIITATFSKAMRSSSITAAGTFTVMETNTSTNVPGTTTYSVINKIASFKPTANLAPDTNYTATITTAAKDLTDNAMASDYTWTFVTADALAPVELVPLGLASTYGIAATAGVTNTATAPNTLIDGDAVLNPTATCNGVQILFSDGPGFGACGGFPPAINGTVVTPLYPDAITAQPITDDLRAAYLSITPANMPGGTSIAAGTTLGAPTGNALVEGDNYFTTGVYTSNTSILITGDLTLDAQGDPDATFVFQSASTVGTAPGARILLIGGAKASNVWWQAGSDATLQTNTIWNGNILAYRDITMVTGASSCGRLFAGAFTDGAFVFDSNHVSVPGDTNAPAGCE
jgi:hypothetical protein